MIDHFDHRHHRKISIPINERTRKKWDIEENHGFVQGLMNGRIYKIRKTHNGNDEKVLKYLNLLELYLYTLKNVMLRNKHLCYDKSCENEAALFIRTPCTLQEIPPGTNFEGINKPKNIVSFRGDGLHFAKDNEYRAGNRHIMLSLRTKSGALRAWSKVKRLFLHEMAHTLCNHITYREAGNHQSDFTKSENFLKFMSGYSPELKEIEWQIQNELF